MVLWTEILNSLPMLSFISVHTVYIYLSGHIKLGMYTVWVQIYVCSDCVWVCVCLCVCVFLLTLCMNSPPWHGDRGVWGCVGGRVGVAWDRGVWGRVGWHGTGVCGAVWGRVGWHGQGVWGCVGEGRVAWDRGVWGRVGCMGQGVCGAVWGRGRVAWDRGVWGRVGWHGTGCVGLCLYIKI